MADVRAVMDAVESKSAWLLGVSEGGPISLLFAATYPERAKGIVLYNTYSRLCRANDYPWGPERDAWLEVAETVKSTWGNADCPLAELAVPSMANDPVYQAAFARLCRLSFAPRVMMQTWELAGDIDVRKLLPCVVAPALVISREGDRPVSCDHGRSLGEHLARDVHAVNRVPGSHQVHRCVARTATHVQYMGARSEAAAQGLDRRSLAIGEDQIVDPLCLAVEV